MATVNTIVGDAPIDHTKSPKQHKKTPLLVHEVEAALDLCAKGNIQKLMALIASDGRYLDAQSLNRGSLLHYAARIYNHEMVAALIKAGAKVNLRHPQTGDTVLHIVTKDTTASRSAYAIIRAGADVEAVNARGERPLHIATTEDNYLVVGMLLDAAAQVNARTALRSMTPLHLAACDNATAVMPLLLKAGAKVNATDANGRTPLHLAASFETATLIPMLVDNKADVNATDHLGRTPLHYTATADTDCNVKALVAAGGKLRTVDKTGRTPLFVAAESGWASVIRALLAAGAPLDNGATWNQSMLRAACVNQTLEAITVLLNAYPGSAVWRTEPITIAADAGISKHIRELVLSYIK